MTAGPAGYGTYTTFCSSTDLVCAGVVGLDNFNDFYAASLKRARHALLRTEGVYVAEGDVNDRPLLQKLFEACRFTHVLYLSNQVP